MELTNLFYPFIGYVLLGIIAGGMAGLLGIGGGVLIVPGLAFIFSLQHMPQNIIMHMAVATSLTAIAVSSIASMRAHYQRGSEIWPIYKKIMLGIIIGTICGVLLARILHTRVLEILFGIFILSVSAIMLWGSQPSPHRQLPKQPWLASIGGIIGLKSGLLGIGGGVIAVPFLTYCNIPMRNAVGISTAISLTVAIIGTISFIVVGTNVSDLPPWSSGFVYWPAVIGINIVSPIFASRGAALSHRLPVPVLKRIFAVFLLLVGIKMLI